MPKSQEPQFHAVADIISRIDECFSDMEAIRNDLRDIQYELSDLDKKLHTIGDQVKDLQGVLLQCYPHSLPQKEEPRKEFLL
jgi:predicted nuclease with TOPRIM domain